MIWRKALLAAAALCPDRRLLTLLSAGLAREPPVWPADGLAGGSRATRRGLLPCAVARGRDAAPAASRHDPRERVRARQAVDTAARTEPEAAAAPGAGNMRRRRSCRLQAAPAGAARP